jgi:hypothetical protein
MPANDGRRSHDYHRIAPIEESGEQREADTSRAIHACGTDAALDIARQMSAQNQILSVDRAGRAHERDDQPQDVRGYADDRPRQLQRVLIMPESVPVLQGSHSEVAAGRELLRTTIGSRSRQ